MPELRLYVSKDDRDIVRKFKALCAGKGTSVSAALMDYMKRQLSKVDLGDLDRK